MLTVLFRIIFLTFFTANVVSASGFLTLKDTVVRSQYIENKSSMLGVKILLGNKINSFNIRNQNSSDSRIDYDINQNGSLGFGVNYKWFGLNILFGLPANRLDIEKKGRTSQLDLQLNIYGKKMVIEGVLSNSNGYYIKNPEAVSLPFIAGVFPQRRDMHTNIISGSYAYVFNYKKFSYRAVFVQNEIQRKSAGSALVSLSYSNYRISADSSLIPSTIQKYYKPEDNIIRGQFNSLALSGGYAHTFVLNRQWFVHFSGLLGPSILFSRIKDMEKEVSLNPYIGGRYNFKSGIGYNHHTFYAVLTLTIDGYSLKINDQTTLQYNVGAFRIAIGKRFKV